MFSLLLQLLLVSAAPLYSRSFPVIITGTPTVDAFYEAPNNLAEYEPGEVIRSRDILVNLELIGSTAKASQVVFRTNDTSQEASYTIVTTLKPWAPSNPAKVLSYQVWEDSVNLDCAPSFGIATGFVAPNAVTVTLELPIFATWALSQGWYVVSTDFEGPKSAFIAGRQEGRAALDGIRAGISHLGLPSDTEVALYGYSGAGHASVWMANLAGSYAPDLNIIGAAHGGTPIDMNSMITGLEGGLFSGFALAGIVGLMHAYPELSDTVLQYANQDLKNAITDISTPGHCILSVVLGHPLETFSTMVTSDSPYPSLTDFPIVQEIYGKESLLANVSTLGVSTPKFPRFIFHSKDDEVVPYPPLKEYVEQRCADGDNIQFLTFDIGGHVTGEIAGIIPSMQFISQLFNHEVPQVTCGTTSPNIVTLDSDNVDDVVGADTVNAIRALNGISTPFGTAEVQ